MLNHHVDLIWHFILLGGQLASASGPFYPQVGQLDPFVVSPLFINPDKTLGLDSQNCSNTLSGLLKTYYWYNYVTQIYVWTWRLRKVQKKGANSPRSPLLVSDTPAVHIELLWSSWVFVTTTQNPEYDFVFFRASLCDKISITLLRWLTGCDVIMVRLGNETNYISHLIWSFSSSSTLSIILHTEKKYALCRPCASKKKNKIHENK